MERWHYSRSLPNQKLVRIGAWEAGRFIGAVVFGDGANPGMFGPYGLTYEAGCELVRVALGKHETSVTRIIALAIRMLVRQSPGLRLIVSFADPEHGHIGGIYQGGNWIYAGMTQAADEYRINGVRMHGRALRSTRSTHHSRDLATRNIEEWARRVLDPNIKRVLGSSKYRYLMPLDAEMRARILPLAQPYPKRAGSIATDAPAHQAGEGGVTPTPALQVS